MQDVLGVGKAVEKLADPVMELLKRIAGPAADEVGLTFRDSVHVYRAKRAYRLAEKFQEFCEKHNVKPVPVSLKILLPILDGASVEDDENLHTMWANLLASAAIPGAKPKPYPAFIEVIRQLSKEEALFYNALWDDLEPRFEAYRKATEAERKAMGWPSNNLGDLAALYMKANSLPAGAERERREEISVARENLERLGLLDLSGRRDPLPQFGRVFAAVCRHPESPVPVHYTPPPSATP